MPLVLVYEFEGVTNAHYAAVSRHLGIDPEPARETGRPG